MRSSQLRGTANTSHCLSIYSTSQRHPTHHRRILKFKVCGYFTAIIWPLGYRTQLNCEADNASEMEPECAQTIGKRIL